jgi:hypothetical protein
MFLKSLSSVSLWIHLPENSKYCTIHIQLKRNLYHPKFLAHDNTEHDWSCFRQKKLNFSNTNICKSHSSGALHILGQLGQLRGPNLLDFSTHPSPKHPPSLLGKPFRFHYSAFLCMMQDQVHIC